MAYKGREVSTSAEHRRNKTNIQFNFFSPHFHTPKVYRDALALNATKHNDVIQTNHRYVPLACMKWYTSTKKECSEWWIIPWLMIYILIEMWLSHRIIWSGIWIFIQLQGITLGPSAVTSCFLFQSMESNTNSSLFLRVFFAVKFFLLN